MTTWKSHVIIHGCNYYRLFGLQLGCAWVTYITRTEKRKKEKKVPCENILQGCFSPFPRVVVSPLLLLLCCLSIPSAPATSGHYAQESNNITTESPSEIIIIIISSSCRERKNSFFFSSFEKGKNKTYDLNKHFKCPGCRALEFTRPGNISDGPSPIAAIRCLIFALSNSVHVTKSDILFMIIFFFPSFSLVYSMMNT